MNILAKLFGQKKSNDLPNEISKSNEQPTNVELPKNVDCSQDTEQNCLVCGQRLDPKISGRLAEFFEMNYWPCPICHFSSSLIVVSDGVIVFERNPLLVTVRKKPHHTYEIMIGIGSLAQPSSNPLVKEVLFGSNASGEVMDALYPKNESKLVELCKLNQIAR